MTDDTIAAVRRCGLGPGARVVLKKLVADVLTETPLGPWTRRALEATHTAAAAPDRLKTLLGLPFTVNLALPDGRRIQLRCLSPEDEIAHALHWHGFDGYEPETTSVFYRLSARSRCILDVGAHVGYYTLLAAAASPGGSTYAFEPVPRIYDQARANVELNGFTGVRCELLAASDLDGPVELYVPPGSLPSSASTLKGFRPAEHTLEVPAARLDTYIRSNRLGAVDLVKIDTEGTEHRVLDGMRTILAEHAPVIISEVLRGRNEAEQQGILEDCGYRWFWLTDRGQVPREHIAGDPTYRFRNYLYVRPDCPDLASLLPSDVRAAVGM